MNMHPLTVGKSMTWETGTQDAQGHHNIKHDVSAILMLKVRTDFKRGIAIIGLPWRLRDQACSILAAHHKTTDSESFAIVFVFRAPRSNLSASYSLTNLEPQFSVWCPGDECAGLKCTPFVLATLTRLGHFFFLAPAEILT
ncbi:hypothetical protein KQX54_012363 [Cotesia glomerata]|uniref:Uncharacterized protein n=1 Tax=Cotesia glomerata TaxID=32391 RepID=A0AAV7IS14_COTGL|nr:hypothetical protein KQX54_012363 [Cotesia glomerata]